MQGIDENKYNENKRKTENKREKKRISQIQPNAKKQKRTI